MPRSSPYYNKAYADFWTYDPQKAKHMLAQAGVSSSFRPTLLSTAQYGMHKDTAEVVQQGLRDIGIAAELRLPEWATRIQLGNRRFERLRIATGNSDTATVNRKFARVVVSAAVSRRGLCGDRAGSQKPSRRTSSRRSRAKKWMPSTKRTQLQRVHMTSECVRAESAR